MEVVGTPAEVVAVPAATSLHGVPRLPPSRVATIALLMEPQPYDLDLSVRLSRLQRTAGAPPQPGADAWPYPALWKSSLRLPLLSWHHLFGYGTTICSLRAMPSLRQLGYTRHWNQMLVTLVARRP